MMNEGKGVAFNLLEEELEKKRKKKKKGRHSTAEIGRKKKKRGEEESLVGYHDLSLKLWKIHLQVRNSILFLVLFE